MIPRTAKRLTSTTSLLSRQALPRPHRLYSTPSKPLNQPAQAQLPRTESLDYYQQQQQGPPQRLASLGEELSAFLKRNVQYTILPTPLPSDRRTAENDAWFADTNSQDLLAVMDACLHNLHDVPRAKSIFRQLRDKKAAAALLSTKVYNAFLEAYINMATEQAIKKPWVDSFWEIFDILKSGEEGYKADTATYALSLIAYHRFHPSSTISPVPRVQSPSLNEILSDIVEKNFAISDIIADRSMAHSEEAAEIIQRLSKAAMELSMGNIVAELGQAEAIGRHVSDILDEIPEAMPTLKKKVTADPNVEGGVVEETEVPFNIDILRKHLASVKLARRVLSDDVAARQRLLEESVYDLASERFQHQADTFASLGITSAKYSADIRQWMWEWHKALRTNLEAIIEDIGKAEKRPGKQPTPLSPYLQLIKADKLSLITILETMRLIGTGGFHDGMKTTRALVAIGKAVEIEYKTMMCRKHKIALPATSSGPVGADHKSATYFSEMGYRNLHERRMVAAKYMDDSEAWTADWTQFTRSKVGGILIDSLMEAAEVEREKMVVDKITGKETLWKEMQPAFHHSYEHIRGQKLGVIRVNPVVAERMAKDPVTETLHPRHLPMLIKPKPWLDVNTGGYIYNKTSAMRFKESNEQAVYLRHAAAQGNCELVFAGLDVLGSTPWKINKDIFNVVLQVWNSGERLGKMPPATYDQPEPKMEDVEETGAADVKAKAVYHQRMKAWLAGKANNHSDRCSVNYKIEIARTFLGDTIYLPHNLDFRGRAYPIPPHLSHIGDDLSRGLLKFAETKPLGERGLRWLKIHLANLYGFDKANFDERVQWCDDHMKDIYDSAENPLDGGKWWQKADDPWQCLATCFELKAALDSPDPLAFESSLPVHQDGTCNGLQHYAALGGDARGAAQVNLAAADRPSDVYTHVGTMVEQLIAKDAEKGDRYAIMLQGKITRKTVKQTVMTTVYGVTFVGAREQIERQLKDKKEIPEEECWGAASYLARKVIICIGDLFSGATAIQTWLNLSARIISKSIPADRIEEAVAELKVAGSSRAAKSRKSKKSLTIADTRLRKEQMTTVVWTTPLGLPIVQPYRKVQRKQIITKLQSVFISDPSSPAEVNTQKQASAFPPNFIHSLDATHMMLTALECRQEGVTFASVHDSYWTHASSIDKMSSVIRDTFIALHSSEVLAKLAEEFCERYKDYKIPLVSLRAGTLIKQLHDAGSRIVVTPRQAESLSTFKDLLTVSETEQTSIDESQVEAAQSIIDEAGAFAVDDLEELIEEDIEADEENESAKRRVLGGRGRGSKERQADKESSVKDLMGKFINLVDILPPLPQKGDFNVATIKKSQYFFS